MSTPWLTAAELAERLRLSKTSVYRLAETGELRGVKLGGQWRFHRQDVEEKLRGSDREIAEGLLEVVSQLLELEVEPEHVASNEALRARVEASLNRMLDGLRSCGIAMLDGIFAEHERSTVGPRAGDELPRVRAVAGELLARLARQEGDDYRGEERYPFLAWRSPRPLTLRILGAAFNGGLQDLASNVDALPLNELLTPLDHLEDCRKNQQTLEAQIAKFLDGPAIGRFESAEAQRAAAIVALSSTRYSRRLMTSETAESLARDLRVRHDLPHSDQRSALYIPAFVGSRPIGGVVMMSREPIPVVRRPLLVALGHLLLSRARNADDLAVERALAREKAGWHATGMLLRRVNHDVAKPLRRADDLLRQILAETSEGEPMRREAHGSLKAIRGQLSQSLSILETNLVTTIPELRVAARQMIKEQRLDRVLEDVRFSWVQEARERGVEITCRLHPSVENRRLRFAGHLVGEILANLVSNAVRYAKKNVQIEARVTRDGDQRVEVDVHDDGPGVGPTAVTSESIREKLTLTSPQPGESGVGLFVSRFLAEELLGGRLALVPSPEGTTFRLNFPVEEAA